MNGDIRVQLDVEVRAALAAAEGDAAGVNKAAIAKKFISLGLPRSTAFKLISKSLGTSADSLPRVPAVVRPDDRPIFTAAAVARDPEGFDKVIGPSGIGLVEALQKCMTAAEDVMAHSRHPDGRVRMGKSLVVASEHLRRVIETAARIHEHMVGIQKIDGFYDALTAALQEAAPDVAARVLENLRHVNTQWRSEAQ